MRTALAGLNRRVVVVFCMDGWMDICVHIPRFFSFFVFWLGYPTREAILDLFSYVQIYTTITSFTQQL